MKYISEIISLLAWPVFIIIAVWLSNLAINYFHKRKKKDGEEDM